MCKKNSDERKKYTKNSETIAETRDRTGDLQIFSLTLSQLSYRGLTKMPTTPLCDIRDDTMHVLYSIKGKGLLRELSPGPLAPEARIMPLDQAADWLSEERRTLNRYTFAMFENASFVDVQWHFGRVAKASAC